MDDVLCRKYVYGVVRKYLIFDIFRGRIMKKTSKGDYILCSRERT